MPLWVRILWNRLPYNLLREPLSIFNISPGFEDNSIWPWSFIFRLKGATQVCTFKITYSIDFCISPLKICNLWLFHPTPKNPFSFCFFFCWKFFFSINIDFSVFFLLPPISLTHLESFHHWPRRPAPHIRCGLSAWRRLRVRTIARRHGCRYSSLRPENFQETRGKLSQ